MTILLSEQSPYLAVAIERIAQLFNPDRIILFGSYARGDAQPGSDLDLLIVLPSIENKRRSAVQIGEALSDLPISKDIVVTTTEEISTRGNVIGSVLRPALREGIPVYERP